MRAGRITEMRTAFAICFALASVASCTDSAPPRSAPDVKPAVAPIPPKLASPIDARPVVDGSLLTLGDPRMRGYSYGDMAINDDRSRIAITEGSAIRVWNLPARTLAFAVPVGGGSPQFVGAYLGVLPMHGNALRWWDSTGHEVPAPYPECTWRVASSSTPPHATKPTAVACAAKSPLRVRVFGTATQTLALDGLTADEDSIDAIGISRDGKWLAASTGYRVHVFDLATGRRAWVREARARDCLAFDRNDHVLLGDSDPHGTHTTLVLVKTTDGSEVAQRGLDGAIEHCDVAGDEMLVVDPTAHTTRVFALPTLEPREVLPAALPQRNAAFSVDGRTIYALNDQHVLAWERDAKRWAPTTGHLGDTSTMALSPKGDTVATVGTDGKLVLWPLDGSPSRTLRDGLDFALTAVAFSLDGARIAVGSAADSFPDLIGTPDEKSVVEVWDVSAGKRVFRVKRSSGSIATLGFAGSGRLFVLDARSELVELDGKTGALRWKRWLVPQFGDMAGGVGVNDAQMSSDATAVMASLSAGKDSTFVVQTMRGKDLDEGSPYGVPRAAGFIPDGRWWRCADEDCKPTDANGAALPVIPVVEFYRQEGPTTVAPSRRNGGIDQAHTGTRCHAFHPDGKRYISCSPDGLVRVWDIERL